MNGRFEKGGLPWNKGSKGLVKSNAGSFKKGANHWLGRKHRPETILKLIKAKLGKTGSLANNWRGGISRNRHSLSTPAYKYWRMEVFIRDNFTCQACGVRGCKLEAHHIKSWAQFPELRFKLENGVALCIKCHALTDNYKGKGHVRDV